MGLDVLELTFEFERAFAVELPDDAILHAATPGCTHRLICERMQLAPDTTCLTGRLFRRLRAAIDRRVSVATRVPRRSPIRSVIGPIAWLRAWNDVRAEQAWRSLPPMAPSRSRSLRDITFMTAVRLIDRAPFATSRPSAELVALRMRNIVSERLAIGPGFSFRSSWRELGLD